MLILNADDVRQALPMKDCIAAMKTAYAALSTGKAEMPVRANLPIAPQEGVSLFMPAFVDDESGQALAVKIVSVFPNNPAKGLPLIHAAVVVMDAETGQTLALLEGGTLTAIRTGAGCGAATDLLARPDSKTAAIFGAGVQSRTQLEAVCSVREIETVWVYSPTPANVNQFIQDMAGQGPIPQDLRPAASPAEAVKNADIISAATTSNTPVFDAADLKPGVHINGAGSYLPDMQETPAEMLAEALITVDSRPAVLEEAGDLIIPINDGVFGEEHIHAEIGEIIAGSKPGRADDQQTTFFKSVGVAVQDAVAGRLALENAARYSLGQEVDW